MTTYNVVLLLAAMIAAGVLGGMADHFLQPRDHREESSRSRSFVLGLVASFLVPLYLATVSSDLISRITSIRYGSGIPFAFLVFVGFCLLASLFSRPLAELVSLRLVAGAEKAKRALPKVSEQAGLARAEDCQEATLPGRPAPPPAEELPAASVLLSSAEELPRRPFGTPPDHASGRRTIFLPGG